MNKQTPWYDIDVRAEIITSLREYLSLNGYDSAVADQFAMTSVRNLMEPSFLLATGIKGLDANTADFVSKKYYELRTLKYCNDSFLHDAAQERLLAYNGAWSNYLRNLLNHVAQKGDPILFVGTADGNEIPDDNYYRYFALEQLEMSISKIDTKKVVKIIVGDFEDVDLIVDKPHSMSVIIALRCMMPNSRIDYFLNFVKHNLKYGGCVIVSHPMGCLLKSGILHRFADADDRRIAFEKRLYEVCLKEGFEVKTLASSSIEQFYELKYLAHENKKCLLLVNLPGETHRTPEEHCGLAFIKAYIQKAGIQVDIIDAYAYGKDINYCKNRFDEWVNLYPGEHLYVGISPFVSSHDHLINFGDYVRKKKKDCFIFLGGHYATLNKEWLMNSLKWLDAIVVGEGEVSVKELLEQNGCGQIPGIYSRGHEKEFVPRERILDLDILPFQDRYLSVEQLQQQPMSITTSRGCYGKCSFCSISSFYKCNSLGIKQTFRSAKSVSDEIHKLVRDFNITGLKIVDDNFFRKHDDLFLQELAALVEHLKLTFRLSARPNDITPSRAALLKKMGVSVVAIGVESTNDESLKLYQKGISILDSENAIAILNSENITCLANFIMFDPIIDLKGLLKNCDFIERHLDDCIFHRINSHLWLRHTDPIVVELKARKLCDTKGFPYLQYHFVNDGVLKVYDFFNEYCDKEMKEYYRHADVIMANGISGHEKDFAAVQKITKIDLDTLRSLIFQVQKGK